MIMTLKPFYGLLIYVYNVLFYFFFIIGITLQGRRTYASSATTEEGARKFNEISTGIKESRVGSAGTRIENYHEQCTDAVEEKKQNRNFQTKGELLSVLAINLKVTRIAFLFLIAASEENSISNILSIRF